MVVLDIFFLPEYVSVVNNFQKSEYNLMIIKFLPSRLLEMFSSKTFNSRAAHYLMVELLLWGSEHKLSVEKQ